ncbi:hypothetical protein Poly30_13040 [Planctomycetes bacterium Poly30]|uniref:HEAT repeat protein n=1 Tax=Saltatorellus ferox TaxID=2528018 RepID=A0A518ENY3_9BACT|nr:hypothetical protein Poly30_13040 [Planctomycetes bacterium Poly30]
MPLLLVLGLALLPQSPEPLEAREIRTLIRRLESGDETRAERAADDLLSAGIQGLSYLPDSLELLEDRWRKSEISFECVERVRALRLMIASAHEEAFEELLKQAGDPRDAVRTRSQYALAVLPRNPSRELIERWPTLSLQQRENSIYALIASGEAFAQDQLVAVLNGDVANSVTARLRAAMGLRAYAREQDAISALEWAVLDSEWSVAFGACSTLWSYGEAGAPGLVSALGSQLEGVRALAGALVADIGASAAEPVLEALMKSPKDVDLLRPARIVAPADPRTVKAFLALRGSAQSALRWELLLGLPELEMDGELRVEILHEALRSPKLALAEEAVFASLRLPDPEFLALREALHRAWLRPDASEKLLNSMGAVMLRLELEPEERLDWCAERIALPAGEGRFIPGVFAREVASEDMDALVERVRALSPSDRLPWLPSLLDLGGGAPQELLLDTARNGSASTRPMVMGYLAMSGGTDEATVEMLEACLQDRTAPEFERVLRGLAKLGSKADGLLDPLLKQFDELPFQVQSTVLTAAARCDPDSKWLLKAAKDALEWSVSDEVRAAAAEALSVGTRSTKSRIKELRAALERGGLAKDGGRKDGSRTVAQLSELRAQLGKQGPTAVAAIATALARLEATDSSTVRALGENLGRSRLQTTMVVEALRQLSPASASQGEKLTEFLWSPDLIVRGASLRSLVEIEGAGVHADVSLAALVLLQPPELAEMAMDGVEALAPEDRPFAKPYLRCAAIRNSWPLNGVGWARPPLEEPWAKEYGIPGPVIPDLQHLHRFDDIRQRATRQIQHDE